EPRNPGVKIGLIPNASDLDLFGKESDGVLADWVTDKVIFTHIGSLGLIHNTNFWMEVAKELAMLDREKKIVLVFIGDGVDKEKLIEEKESTRLDNIHFLGL